MISASLVAGVVGTVTFVVTFSVDGNTRPGYRPVRHAVSALALGPRGWLQTTNFVVCGVLITMSGFGLAGRVGSALLGILVAFFGLALVASGAFPMDRMRGYPPGTPDVTPEETSARHRAHDWAGMVVFSTLPAAAAIAALALSGGWAIYSAITAVAMFVLFFAFGAAWERDDPRTGLLQRLTIVVGWSWLALLCAWSWWSTRPG